MTEPVAGDEHVVRNEHFDAVGPAGEHHCATMIATMIRVESA